MRLIEVAAREFFKRRTQVFTGIAAVALGISVIVGVVSITRSSEKEVSEALDNMGAPVLIIPKNAALQDYYGAELGESVMPEEYLCLLTDSGMAGSENISAELFVAAEVKGIKTVLAGIVTGKGITEDICGEAAFGLTSAPRISEFRAASTLKSAFTRVIEELEPGQAAVGAEIGSRLKLKPGDSVDVCGNRLIVKTILPEEGTVADNRIFTDLRTVQHISGYAASLHSIEISGCPAGNAAQLTNKINDMLPLARVVTLNQQLTVRMQINGLMRRISIIMLIMMALTGAACIANFMFANVDERRMEMGIFMALGADSGWIVRLILIKAVFVGIIGGALGYILGTAGSMALGAKIAGVEVKPVLPYALWSILIAVTVSLIASIVPALRAASLDPSSIMKEE